VIQKECSVFNLQATELVIVTSATKGVVVTTCNRFSVWFRILYVWYGVWFSIGCWV